MPTDIEHTSLPRVGTVCSDRPHGPWQSLRASTLRLRFHAIREAVLRAASQALDTSIRVLFLEPLVHFDYL